MKFNIVEDTRPRYAEKYDEFIKLYNNGALVKDIRERLGWGRYTYYHAREKALSEGLIADRTKKPKNPAGYRKTGKGYFVERRVNKVTIRKWCKTEEEAMELVKYLNEKGWTKENLERYREEKRCM